MIASNNQSRPGRRWQRAIAASALIAWAIWTPAPSFAQAGRAAMRQASAAERARVQQSAREIVNEMFSRLCPGRCELIQLDVRMGEPRAIGALEPGFEDQAPQSYRARVESLHVDILLDSALPASFRQNIPRMLRYRMVELAETVDIRTESLVFPEPQLEPTPPMLPEQPRMIRYAPSAPPPPMEAPPPPPEEPAAASPPTPPVDPWAVLWPWLALGGLLFLVGLVVAYWLGTSRQRALDKTASGAVATRHGEDNERLVWLERELAETLSTKRAVTNSALRKWMLEDSSAVAEFVKNFGPSCIHDLRNEDELVPALSRIGSHLVSHPKRASTLERTRLYEEARARFFQAELDASRLAGWDFLEGVSSIQLDHVLDAFSPTERAVVLSELSAPARAAVAEGLSEAERFSLALHAADSAAMSAENRRQLRARVRAEVDAVRAHIGQSADGRGIVAELLRVASAHEQLALARQISREQPQLARNVLERVVLESALTSLPQGVLADASAQLSIDELAAYLRGAEGGIRETILEQIPGRLRNAVEPELELAMPITKARFHAARQALVDRTSEALRRDGRSPLAFNHAVLGSGILDVRKEAAE